VFSLGGSEILIVIVIALLLFGPDKIPQLARTIGRFMKEFNKYKDIMESTIRMEVSRADDDAKEEPTLEQRISKAAGASTAILQESRSASEPESDTEDGDGAEGDAAAADAPRPVARPSADESDEEDLG
jgi:TatA/E family protein of Tat protein translocase